MGKSALINFSFVSRLVLGSFQIGPISRRILTTQGLFSRFFLSAPAAVTHLILVSLATAECRCCWWGVSSRTKVRVAYESQDDAKPSATREDVLWKLWFPSSSTGLGGGEQEPVPLPAAGDSAQHGCFTAAARVPAGGRPGTLVWTFSNFKWTPTALHSMRQRGAYTRYMHNHTHACKITPWLLTYTDKLFMRYE